ncbi:formate dehydrogenase [Massilia sp. WF1]|uniref:formate dehydrogenase accessory sulfurtransferase FdhD n=1 Tax=unclassified Massilia TaxID=2609279 RepID=UPI000690DF0E|nr:MULTISPECIES: formate dehydrogenase accessory sulfurtransferase FdhD [unclassified Massilia]ALK96119.1 formate dehydrogenase accessory protein FdhD [Massilia sp. WG5]KNZ67304.1 formate dehydrogenase [Massilia sp. WF1]
MRDIISDDAAPVGPAGFQLRSIVRHRGDSRGEGHDSVAEEMPLALVVNGISHVVMMVTPRDLEAFAVGFALTEGLVDSRAQIYDAELRIHARAAEVELTVAQEAFQRLKGRRRALAGRTGCGVCGIESLALLDLAPEKMAPAALPADLVTAIARAAAELPRHQTLMRETGGVHAAAWCGHDGAIAAVFEDVGRHNALDKLVGHLALQGIDLRSGFVFMSSRASYELARKTARMGIPMLATISAPSSLAVDIAAQAGLKLASFCRQDGFVEYT